MIIPAPAPLGDVPTLAFTAPFGRIAGELLEEAADANRAPVILHALGGEEVRQSRGPREMREETLTALEKANWEKAWGLGGICTTTEDAAQFATAGFTWFRLELAPYLEPRAATMSLDELDASIVTLEDTGAYPANWYEPYLSGIGGLRDDLNEEELARAAVRFGSAIKEATRLLEAIRTHTSGRGDMPDLEISVATSTHPITPIESAFLCLEAIGRGLLHNSVTRFIPASVGWHEPGGTDPTELPSYLSSLRDLLPSSVRLSLPDPFAKITGWEVVDRDATERSRLLALQEIASKSPTLFREWLTAARHEFPTAMGRHLVSTTEDDVRFLPEVLDEKLIPTFLDTREGRQLLLTTWEGVADRFIGKIELG